MANIKPRGKSGKLFNRNLHLAKDAMYIQNGDFVPNSVVVSRVANADCIDGNIFVANRKYKVIGISEVHTTAGSDGSAVTLSVNKCTGTQTPAQGTTLMSGTFDMKGTAQTVQNATLVALQSTLILNAGDRLALDFAGTITALAGVQVTVDLMPV